MARGRARAPSRPPRPHARGISRGAGRCGQTVSSPIRPVCAGCMNSYMHMMYMNMNMNMMHEHERDVNKAARTCATSSL